MIRSGGSLGALIRNNDEELESNVMNQIPSGRYIKNVSQTIQKNSLNLGNFNKMQDTANQYMNKANLFREQQCDFVDTEEFFNSLIEKANKKNVNSLNFMDMKKSSI